ncbi:cyclic nucleotide-gated ion channel 1 isoform X2 [Rosa chinensis]|uniref:cyclic nucleotide-gated ion channel 1 isoform X2 n=1 Tax=Rosa chinensis TaxID=74649 RepID=UPI000D090B0B|nr:cyclic nucleotide-gated ion channel 1 isoform X2 [Rosa chinensis]XP_024157855.1 cyclic nucleotide-gated ion channel 1 isoform X2 [Rosa chinensis]
MDNRETPEVNIVVSVPSSLGIVDGIERQDPVTRTPIRKAWATVSTLVVDICSEAPNLISNCLEMIMTWALIGILGPFVFVAIKWKRVFILSCVAVSFDSLFLYIPIIDQENKCLDTDKTLRNVALVLRSLTDIAFIFHIIALINDFMDEGPKWDDHASASRLPRKLKLVREVIAKKMPWLSIRIVVNFLAILPIPQVAIVVGSFRLGGSKHFLKQTIINVFLVFQYFLRIFQMFLSIKKIGDTVGKLVKGSFYFLMYIIAGCVFAAFWYFFSIQRETSCWDQACQTIAGCMPIYDCGHSTSLNSTFLNKLCPIESPNATPFDFGMFHDILKSGITESTNFFTKFFYSFWWGLKNLSNFGTNLETSSYIWENCFAILICVVGLLLFLFLIGSVQAYIEKWRIEKIEKSEKIRELRRTRIDTKYRDIEKWMSSHDIPPGDMWFAVMTNIEEDYLVNHIDEDVDASFMFYCTYGFDLKSNPLGFVCVKALKKIPILRKLDEQDLEVFISEPLLYYTTKKKRDDYIIRAGGGVDSMYLIIDGVIECKDAETMSTQIMRRYDCCGEEVLRWAILNYKRSRSDRDPLPISTVDVKCQTKTEAFEFTADDLIEILEKLNNSELLEALAHDSSTDQRIEDWLLRNGFPEDLKANIINFLDKNNRLVEENTDADVDVDFLFGILPNNIKSSIKRHLGMNALKKVPMLQKMHEYVLEIICNHLEPVVYKKNSYVVRAGEPLGIMILILRGRIIFTDTTSSKAIATSSSEITETCDENVIEIESYYGEQLLRWASPNNISSSANPVISTRDVKCQTKVEALILKAEDLRSAVSKCGSQWNFNHSMNSQNFVGYGRSRVADTGASASTSPNNEQAIQLHQGHDMLLEQLIMIRNDMSTQRRRLDEMATFLAKLGYTSASSPPPTP